MKRVLKLNIFYVNEKNRLVGEGRQLQLCCLENSLTLMTIFPLLLFFHVKLMSMEGSNHVHRYFYLINDNKKLHLWQWTKVMTVVVASCARSLPVLLQEACPNPFKACEGSKHNQDALWGCPLSSWYPEFILIIFWSDFYVVNIFLMI